MSNSSGKNSGSGPGKILFTPMSARAAQAASVRSRNLRKQVRAEMLNKLVTNLDFGDELLSAIKSKDMDQINLLQTALRLVGLTHDQSEDAVQHMKVDTKSETNSKVDSTIKFVLDPPAPKA